MGMLFSKVWVRMLGSQEMKILMVGLDAAGKTTILYRLKLAEVVTTIPTVARWGLGRFSVASDSCRVRAHVDATRKTDLTHLNEAVKPGGLQRGNRGVQEYQISGALP